MSKQEDYKRCYLCDYCHISQPTERKRKFNLDFRTNEFICSDCVKSVNDVIRSYDYTINNTPSVDEAVSVLGRFDFRNRREGNRFGNAGSKKKPTLAGVTGVNEGPRVDLDTMSRIDSKVPPAAGNNPGSRQTPSPRDAPVASNFELLDPTTGETDATSSGYAQVLDKYKPPGVLP